LSAGSAKNSLRAGKTRSPDSTRRAGRADPLELYAGVAAAGLELSFLDPQQLREFRVVAVDLLDEALSILPPEKDVDRVTDRARGRDGLVDHGVDDHCDSIPLNFSHRFESSDKTPNRT
jgi:hypothetical protein